jgi:DNA mismatch repair protein MutL
MARTIQILPDPVANQIAAGEVVERPASVVKELVENALDARADRVEVDVEAGGKRRIRVSDDGSGMGREDALLSLDRHATSKIRSAEDLRGVRTFGFRGEALPSIASVSRLTLDTCLQGEEMGTRIRVKGGRITSVEDLARTPGTSILVEGLFFNAPARARFLGSAAAETRSVSEAVNLLALANSRVRLSLRSGDRTLLEVPSTPKLTLRVAGVWGDEVSQTLIPLEHEADGMRLEGLIQRPDAVPGGFRRAALFVSGRPFRDAALLRAVERGYRTTIPSGHRPWMVLFLDVVDGAVDVNVHPTKAEVRFRDSKAVEQLLEAGVRQALEGEASAATFESSTVRTPTGGEKSAPGSPARVRERPDPSGRAGPGGESDPPAPSSAVKEPASSPEEDQMALFLPGGSEGSEPAERAVKPEGTSSNEDLPAMERPRLWQVHQAWILAEVRDGLLLIDQHAAHERVLFERIMARFDGGGAESQRLLFPLTIQLTPAEYDLVQDLKGLLNRAGFEVEGFGGDTVIVHAVPDPHPHFEAERCFREMIDELTHGSELVRSARNQHERVAMSFACKAAIKAGQLLQPPEMQELFDQLFATELPFHDVHGRPTTVRLSRTELERKFGR